jgi:hypothetical protein
MNGVLASVEVGHGKVAQAVCLGAPYDPLPMKNLDVCTGDYRARFVHHGSS